jgi:DNA-binding response OmpR family regulator
MNAASATATECPVRTALAVDVDPPFQQVLRSWLSARGYRPRFMALAEALGWRGGVDLVVCELGEPKHAGAQTLRALALSHPGVPLIAMSARFVAAGRCDALARQLGAQAALAKPCTGHEFHAALDAAAALRAQEAAQDPARAAPGAPAAPRHRP